MNTRAQMKRNKELKEKRAKVQAERNKILQLEGKKAVMENDCWCRNKTSKPRGKIQENGDRIKTKKHPNQDGCL